MGLLSRHDHVKQFLSINLFAHSGSASLENLSNAIKYYFFQNIVVPRAAKHSASALPEPGLFRPLETGTCKWSIALARPPDRARGDSTEVISRDWWRVRTLVWGLPSCSHCVLAV